MDSPRAFWPLEALLAVTLIGGGRLGLRWYLETNGRSGGTDDERGVATLVYGAGDAGAAVTRMSQRDQSLRLRIVGFLDDDESKRRMVVMGQRVRGTIDDLAAAVRKTGARQLIVAMPSASGATIRRAVEAGRTLDLEVRVVPPLSRLMGDPDTIGRIRPVQVEDLLRREPVKADLEELTGYLNGVSVLVTGAGGSIGSELCRQILSLGPRTLVAVDNNEYALWRIERELGARQPGRDAGNPGCARRRAIATGRRPSRRVDSSERGIPCGGPQACSDLRGPSRRRPPSPTSSEAVMCWRRQRPMASTDSS